MAVTTGEQFLAQMLYGGRAQCSIDWEQIDESRKQAPFLTDQERCELMLRAVNGEVLPMADWNRLVGAPVKMAFTAKELHLSELPLYEEARPALKAALDRIIEDPTTANRVMGQDIAVILNGYMLTLPELNEVAGKWVRRERVIAASIGPALIYALTILLDPLLPYGGLLRRCCLDECGRFAFGQPPETPGQPPNFYCTRDHALRHARLRGAERSAAHRRGISVEEYRIARMRESRKIGRKHK